jgi:Na+/H+ antiporter NhaD/arsenite permease-like protein
VNPLALATVAAGEAAVPAGPAVFGVPLTVILFVLTLGGVLVLHRRSLEIALGGWLSILLVQLTQPEFHFAVYLGHEWVKTLNLFGLLVGFALLADHFEESHLPAALAHLLPRGVRGCFTLLVVVWAISGVIDNIAAAMIGATAAARLFDRRLHLGYLVAIVAAANSGGAGSVIGDTTTTMIWLEGISPLSVLPAYVGAAVALVVFGLIASLQQARHAPLQAAAVVVDRIDGRRLAVVLVALAALVLTNVATSAWLGHWAQGLPALAIALWTVLLAAAAVRAPRWRLIPASARGGVFLIALVLSASLMPVHGLPRPGAGMTLAIGFVSAIFDNIPLTKLALDQGGYDWGLLAYAVGTGGSMLWFGSSAGVAVGGIFPQARSTLAWLRAGWHVPVGFALGYLTQYALFGWRG